MSEGAIFDLWRSCMQVIALVAAPFIVTGLVVGLTTSMLQSATQLQEQILSFVPKVAAMGLVLTFAGSWVLRQLVAFVHAAMLTAIQIGQGGAH